MQRASLASEAAFAGWTSNVSSSLGSPVSGAFVYVNFPAEQATRDDLASPEMNPLKIDPIRISPNTNSSHQNFMKASLIDGFPNEFKQRGFKAGVFSREKSETKDENKTDTVSFEFCKGNLLPLYIPGTRRSESTVEFLCLPASPFFPFHTSGMIDWLGSSKPGKVLLAHGAEGTAFSCQMERVLRFIREESIQSRLPMLGNFEEVT